MPSYSFGPYLANSSRLSKPQKSNLLVRRLVFNSLNFLRNPQNPPRASGAWRHPHFVTRFIISGYCDIFKWHVRSVRACVTACIKVLHLTNLCAEPKGSQPNQTQRHEPKSPGHYITVLATFFTTLKSWWRFIKTETFQRWLSNIIDSSLLNYIVFIFFHIYIYIYIYILEYGLM